MARVVSGVLVPTTTTPGQNIAHFTPDTGTTLIGTQCGGWLRTWSGAAAALGVVGLFEDTRPLFECRIQGSMDYGQGGVVVLPMEHITVGTGGSVYFWAFVPFIEDAAKVRVAQAILANTYWHAAFMYQ